MSANFFKLPESVKRRIWAELLKEWAKKRSPPPTEQVTGLQDEFPNVHLVSQFTTDRG